MLSTWSLSTRAFHIWRTTSWCRSRKYCLCWRCTRRHAHRCSRSWSFRCRRTEFGLQRSDIWRACSSVRLNKHVQVRKGTRSWNERVLTRASRSATEAAVAPAARAARMRTVNLENEVSSWQSGQHTTAQTFMLEFSGVFIRAESRRFGCWGFWFWTCAFYTLSDREHVAGKYDMSAFLPIKMDKTTAVYC